MKDLDAVEAEIREAVGVRWGAGCFAERELWGECPDLAGERCPYCWAVAALRHQRAEGLWDAAAIDCSFCASGNQAQREHLGWRHHFGRGHPTLPCKADAINYAATAIREGGA